MHDDIACEGYGKIIAKALLASLISKVNSIALQEFLIREITESITRIEHLEEETVTLFSILTEEGRELLHRRSLYLAVAVECIHLADGVKDIIATSHLYGAKVSHALRYRWFLHLLM